MDDLDVGLDWNELIIDNNCFSLLCEINSLSGTWTESLSKIQESLMPFERQVLEPLMPTERQVLEPLMPNERQVLEPLMPTERQVLEPLAPFQ